MLCISNLMDNLISSRTGQVQHIALQMVQSVGRQRGLAEDGGLAGGGAYHQPDAGCRGVAVQLGESICGVTTTERYETLLVDC